MAIARPPNAELSPMARAMGAKPSSEEANTPIWREYFVEHPTFHQSDPSQPGWMSKTPVGEPADQTQAADVPPITPAPSHKPAASSTNPQPTTEEPAMPSDFMTKLRKHLIIPIEPTSTPTNPQPTTEEPTVTTEQQAKAAQTTADETIKKAQDAAKSTSKKLTAISIFGGIVGAGAVVGGVGYALSSLKANLAAEAAASAATTATTAATTAAETAAAAGAATAAEGASVAGLVGAVTAKATFLGLTMPVWGWAAAAVAIATGAYLGYKWFKRDKSQSKPADAPKAATPATDGVTAAKAARAFFGGVATGATVAAGVIGTATLVGLTGAAILGKTVALYGPLWGAVVAVGGAWLSYQLSMVVVNGVTQYLVARNWSKKAEAAQAAETKTDSVSSGDDTNASPQAGPAAA